MHDWVFRHLDELRPIYGRDTLQRPHDHPGTGPSVGQPAAALPLAPGTSRRLPGLRDVAMAPMRVKATSSSGDLPGSNAKLDADAKLGGCLKLCANIYAASNVGKVQILEGLDFLNQLTLVVLHFAAIIMTFTQRVATSACMRVHARARSRSCEILT